MNWRAVIALVAAAPLDRFLLPKLGWNYRLFHDPFRFSLAVCDVSFFLILFGVVLAFINAVMGPEEKP